MKHSSEEDEEQHCEIIKLVPPRHLSQNGRCVVHIRSSNFSYLNALIEPRGSVSAPRHPVRLDDLYLTHFSPVCFDIFSTRGKNADPG